MDLSGTLDTIPLSLASGFDAETGTMAHKNKVFQIHTRRIYVSSY
tara:strand:+ start:2574 stop:2708 length:135 start_codon:yes stop_codon:yes gene_type:complete